MKWWWLSTAVMTVAVATRDGRITVAPPIVSKFKGQPLSNLIAWLRTQPGFQMKEI